MSRSSRKLNVYLGNDNSQQIIPTIYGSVRDHPVINILITVTDQSTGERVYSESHHVNALVHPWNLPAIPGLKHHQNYIFAIREIDEKGGHVIYQTTIKLHG